MGIYDRDYYRREGPSILGSFVEHGKVCKWLIAINVACFVLQLLTQQSAGPEELERFGIQLPRESGWFTDLFLLDVSKVLQGQVWRLLTGAFLHSELSLWHIVFNMLALWWFGTDVEDIYGPREFLAFYLSSAILANVAYVLAYLAHVQPGGRALGASGAVTAVLVLCAMHYPTRIIYVFFLLPVPIWLFVVLSVAQDLFGLLGGGFGLNVGFSAHLGGAAFGFIYYKMHWRILNLWPDFSAWRRPRVRSRLRIYREEDEPDTPVRAATAPAHADEQLEARMDAVLRKVSDHGIDSLTEQERNILLQASERFKRRRH
jgi:membrane associated rhomboid family serine protease